MSVKLYDLDMNPIFLRGVKWLEFVPKPVTVERITEKVNNGDIPMGKKTNSRLINARFMYESADFLDYKLLRNELYRIFSPLNDMWAVDDHVPGIKWFVDVESYEPERINGRIAEVSVVFYSPETYARSVGNSLDPYTYDSGLWSYGMGLQLDAGTHSYIHTSDLFTIYNPSDVPINPREDELKIILKSITATGSDIRIKNITTGDEWRYQGPFNAEDSITIDGILTKRNGMNAVGMTAPRFELISLAKGVNEFAIVGLTGEFEISFEFPFLYV